MGTVKNSGKKHQNLCPLTFVSIPAALVGSSLNLPWYCLFASNNCVCVADSTAVTTSWRHISKWLVSTWKMRIQFRPRRISTARRCCKPSRRVKTFKYITRQVVCTVSTCLENVDLLWNLHYCEGNCLLLTYMFEVSSLFSRPFYFRVYFWCLLHHYVDIVLVPYY